MLPLTLHLAGGQYGEQDFKYEVVRSMSVAPSLIGLETGLWKMQNCCILGTIANNVEESEESI